MWHGLKLELFHISIRLVLLSLAKLLAYGPYLLAKIVFLLVLVNAALYLRRYALIYAVYLSLAHYAGKHQLQPVLYPGAFKRGLTHAALHKHGVCCGIRKRAIAIYSAYGIKRIRIYSVGYAHVFNKPVLYPALQGLRKHRLARLFILRRYRAYKIFAANGVPKPGPAYALNKRAHYITRQIQRLPDTAHDAHVAYIFFCYVIFSRILLR